MDFKITLPFITIWSGVKKIVKWLRKSSTQEHGKVDVSKVIDQGSILSFADDHDLIKMTVKDLNKYFLDFAEKNIHERYLKDGATEKDLLPEEKKVKFIINNTRISTFFVFTDGYRILLLNRAKTKDGFHRVENTKYDVFGSVSFENCTILLKLTKNDFLDSKIVKIEGVPGLAFEDSVETEDNLLGRQTIIMLGFAVYVSEDDLSKAESNNSYDLCTFTLDNLPDSEVLTSKSKLSIDYLATKGLTRT